MARQKTVLDAMVQLHMINPQQEQQAEQETAKFDFKPYVDSAMIQAPHFVHYVVDHILVPLLGAQNLYTGGYNIYTPLHLNVWKKNEQNTYYRLYPDSFSPYFGCQGPLPPSHNVNNTPLPGIGPL